MRGPGRSSEAAVVGPYRLLQRLGEGGMGVVHLALDPEGRAVAVKVLRPAIANDPDARRRLAREVATLRRVRHPRVAAVIDADTEGDVPYLVTHFVPGKPLDGHVREHGPLPRGHVARVGAVLADALKAIHAAGVVHRDVKPANVMLLDGEPVLIDFGIAHVADESRITHTGLVMGTPGYLSPEVVGGDDVTEATDWWGWGATLAFAATGRPPFGTGPIEVVLDRVRRGASDISGVDDGLAATLTSALQVDPARRPAPEVLVAGLAAAPPSRRPADRVVDLTAPAAAPVAAAPAALPAALSEAATEKVPPPAAVTEVVPHPGAAGEGITEVVPAPTALHTPPTPPPGDEVTARVHDPATRRFDPPTRPQSPPPADGFADPYRARGPVTYAPPVPIAPHLAGGAAWGPPTAGQAVDPSGGPAPHGPDAPGPDPDDVAEPVDPADCGRGVLLGSLVVLSAIAAVAPFGAIWIVGLLITAARVLDRTTTALLLRRQQHGPRPSDATVSVLALPWRTLVAGLSTAFLLVLPALIGISVAFIVASAAAGGPTRATPGNPGALAAGMAALLVAAWAGPGGGQVRRGARAAVLATVRTRQAQYIVWGVLGLTVVAALMVADQQDKPDWGPWKSTSLVNFLSDRPTPG
jgi:hypothetical protein